MRIEVEDDKKEKWQSVTAKVLLNGDSSFGGFDTEVCGYGYNEEEARAELLKELILIKVSFNKDIDSAMIELDG